MIFLNALQAMLSITLLTVVGYVLAWRGYISTEVEIFIPRFITQIAVPPYLFSAVILHFDRERLAALAFEALIPLVAIIVSFFLFLLLGKLCRIDKKHLGLAATGAATSNTIFIGIPVNNALFGTEGLVHLLLYFLANTLFFWTIGNYAIAREGVHEGRSLTKKELARRIFSPPLLGSLTGLACLLLEVPVPRFVTDTCTLLGGLCTPLALVFVGVILRRVDWKAAHMGKDIILTLVGRFVLSPLVILGILALVTPMTGLAVPDITRQVYAIQSGLPSMTNIALISAFYGADKDFGSVFVCLTTIVGMLAVPIWMTLLAHVL